MVDLIINGTTVTLYGIQTYDVVQIINGGTLDVQAYDGTVGTGTIEIHANSILVDATSSILGDARGFIGALGQDFVGLIRDSEGPGRGSGTTPGSGAGYGGNGGGTNLQPGLAYGTLSGTDIERGSGGGCGNTGTRWGVGGSGGALVALYATYIEIAGTISSNGGGGITAYPAYPHYEGSGGGSGGGILLSGGTIIVSGTLSANGGFGSDALDWYHTGGDGGAGGRIKLFPSSAITFTGTETIIGGLGGVSVGPGPGLPGESGTIYHADIPVPTMGDVCIKSNPSGASITIDGTLQSGKTTALSGTSCIIDNTVVGLPPGIDNHTYIIDLIGYQPKLGNFSIIAGMLTEIDTGDLIPITSAGGGGGLALLSLGLLVGLLIKKKCEDRRTREECEKAGCQWKDGRCIERK